MELRPWRKAQGTQGARRPALNDLEYVHRPYMLRAGNQVTVLRSGREAYPAMLEAIAGAKRIVHLETYILRSDATGRLFGEALKERASAGVAVRLMYDAVGSLGISDDFVGDLHRAGVTIVEYRPIAPWRPRWGLSRRDHRKILTIDDGVAFTGGLNLGNEYSPRENGGDGWHDVHVRVEGPCALELARIFRKTWIRAGGSPFPVPPDPSLGVDVTAGTPHAAHAMTIDNKEMRRRSAIRRAYLHAIHRAKRTISIMNAYFIPDLGIRFALRRAAERGVSVKVIVPSNSDVPAALHASHYLFPWLLRAGIRIFEWPEKMMHAKTAVVDSTWSTIGSYNLDYRSLLYNLEVVLAIVDRRMGAEMQAQFDSDIEKCREVNLTDWKRRPFFTRLTEWLCYQFQRWL
ncbi:MAG: cardiolipin synthase ClsB [Deltaproteobacteria bacterium]|nr:cardiolipin synthase ClsB [Deltaproteobacteria bacterium]